MQRKRNNKKSTRPPVSDEKKFIKLVSEHHCCECGWPAPSIVDHCQGSSFIHNKALIGHWFVLPYCQECDEVKTISGRAAYLKRFGRNQSQAWEQFIENCPTDSPARKLPAEVFHAVLDWNR